MNGRLATLAVIGLSAALAVASAGWWHEAQGTPPLKLPPWEYKVFYFHGGLDEAKHGTNPDEATKLFNKLADEGWEYVGLVAAPYSAGDIRRFGYGGHVAFKRPKKQG